MKRDYSKWCSVALIAAIYVLAGVAGWQDTELQNALHEAAANNRAVRHSEPFRNIYKPHYRLVKL